MNREMRALFPSFFCCAISIMLAVSCRSSGEIQTLSAKERFELGKQKFDDGDYLEAMDDFTAVTLQYPGSDVADDAQFFLAECRFRRGEFLLAAYEYETLRRNMPSSPFDAKAQYMIGLSYYSLSPKSPLDQDYTRKAIDAFQAFLEYFPTHELAPDGEGKIRELTNRLARKDYDTAVLYMKMENFKAATFYFDAVIDKYHDTEYAERAHFGKIEALVARRRFEEARVEIDRFQVRYPNSEFRDGVESLKGRVNEGVGAQTPTRDLSDHSATADPR